MSNHSSPFPSCFRRTSSTVTHHSAATPPPPPPPPPPPISGKPNLTTCLYQTNLGLFALTWSRTLLTRSLHLHLFLSDQNDAVPSPSFHLQIKPFIFWNKHGRKKLSKSLQIFWDLSGSKFGSRPEPQSGFFIAILADGLIALLLGDSPSLAYTRTHALYPHPNTPPPPPPQTLVLKREHVYGSTRFYTTKASFGGKTRNVSIECRFEPETDPTLCFAIDRKRVLQIKHLKWKFRGNERIEVEDGVFVQISWDVYNWLFEDEQEQDGSALFMFKFENLEEDDDDTDFLTEKNGMALWSHKSSTLDMFEKKKMMKKGRLLRTTRSSSSSSLSSASSGCSSVMEWASVEENELKGPPGFCLLVYAWKNGRI